MIPTMINVVVIGRLTNSAATFMWKSRASWWLPGHPATAAPMDVTRLGSPGQCRDRLPVRRRAPECAPQRRTVSRSARASRHARIGAGLRTGDHHEVAGVPRLFSGSGWQGLPLGVERKMGMLRHLTCPVIYTEPAVRSARGAPNDCR